MDTGNVLFSGKSASCAEFEGNTKRREKLISLADFKFS